LTSGAAQKGAQTLDLIGQLAVLSNADIAMYQAKRDGGNNYKRFTLEMNA